jgi:hypothetical protein
MGFRQVTSQLIQGKQTKNEFPVCDDSTLVPQSLQFQTDIILKEQVLDASKSTILYHMLLEFLHYKTYFPSGNTQQLV